MKLTYGNYEFKRLPDGDVSLVHDGGNLGISTIIIAPDKVRLLRDFLTACLTERKV